MSKVNKWSGRAGNLSTVDAGREKSDLVASDQWHGCTAESRQAGEAAGVDYDAFSGARTIYR